MALSLSDLLRRMLECRAAIFNITTNSPPKSASTDIGAARLAAINAG